MIINSPSSQRNPNEHRNHKTRHFDYNSRIWKITRHEVLIRDNRLCIPCQKEGRVTPAWGVDHKRPIKDGGDPLDKSNLQSICKPCHDSKSSKERIR